MSEDKFKFRAIDRNGKLGVHGALDFTLGTLIECDGVEYFYSSQPVGHDLFEPGHEPMWFSAYGEAFRVEDFAQFMRTCTKYPRIKYCVFDEKESWND